MKKVVMVLVAVMMALPAYALDVSISGAEVDSEVKLSLGGDVRLRWYDFENFWDFNDDTDNDDFQTFRLRTRLYTKATLSDGVSGFVRIANQTYGEGVYNGGPDSKNAEDKVFVDNAYIDVKNFFGAPIDLRLGRQNLMYGSGFVLFDGESESASTAIFFDAVKLTWHMADNAKMDLIYAMDEENNRQEAGRDDDITLGGAYVTANFSAIGDQQEIYVLNRRDEGLKKDIWMGGLRMSDKLDFGLDYSAEVAMQTGDAYDDGTQVLDQDALGYKVEVGYSLPTDGVTLRPFIGYASLSGDEDPNDDDFEGWDVFYGGWPQFGDLLAWASINIGGNNMSPNYEASGSVIGEANYSNLNMATLGVNLGLGKLKSTLSYTQMTFDDKDTASGSNTVAFDNDDDYGDYYQLQMKYPYSKALSFSLYAAMIEPGSAFPNTNDDTAHEFFLESNLSF